MSLTPGPVGRLIEELSRLPGMTMPSMCLSRVRLQVLKKSAPN